MKKLIKILPIVMTAMIVLMTVTPVFAYNPGSITPDTSKVQGTKIETTGKTILGIIQVIGTIAAVGILMVIGIRYMMGSAQEKAEYKKVMIPYIIGAIILFAASNLAGYIYSFATGAFVA